MKVHARVEAPSVPQGDDKGFQKQIVYVGSGPGELLDNPYAVQAKLIEIERVTVSCGR